MTDDNEIGQRIRAIRRRRGLSLNTAAGLVGISKAYLSMLETGSRRVDSRGLLDRLADALGCSVLDLTGEPYVPAHRHTADALRAIPDIQVALADTALDDVPDLPARPLLQLVEPLRAAHVAYMDQARYDIAGRGLGRLLADLHIHAVAGIAGERRQALELLVEACIVAFGVTKNLGHPDLALMAAQRGYEAAKLSGDPALLAFAGQRRGQAFQRVGAVRRAGSTLRQTLDATMEAADPSAQDTRAGEGVGLLHLTAALNAARRGEAETAHDHLDAAADLATWTGERNAFAQHFGPANLGVWRISIGVELGEGARVVDAVTPTINLGDLASADRVAMLRADSARALAQEGGARDLDAVRQLDLADRTAPARLRQDPVVRSLVSTLAHRAPRRTWELDSLRHRFGVGSPAVNS
ncbi:helix-turn-helix domain-containing protein [Amycolatopsis mediterranei]|uniref:helix-turn-helix domain-containing protein n=1 Tax=Amycolatopsis mediterranei TaxID=33910 RepID=UPI003416FF82